VFEEREYELKRGRSHSFCGDVVSMRMRKEEGRYFSIKGWGVFDKRIVEILFVFVL
jgi:Tat protein secretion system quality control protein TatD with DNase activity